MLGFDDRHVLVASEIVGIERAEMAHPLHVHGSDQPCIVHHFCRGRMGQTSAQGYGAWLVAPLQHAHMIGIQYDHGMPLPLALRR